MSDINALIAQGSKFGNAFGNFADSYEDAQKIRQAQAYRNALLQQQQAQDAALAGYRRDSLKHEGDVLSETHNYHNQEIGLRERALNQRETPRDLYGERANAAVKFGLQEGTPDYQNFVLYGKAPEPAKLPRTGMATVDGRAQLVNLDTGEVIKDLGQAGQRNQAALPAETAARVGLAKNFQSHYPQLRKDIAGPDVTDAQGKITTDADGIFSGTAGRAGLIARTGKQGETYRGIKAGSEAMVRMLTGAGMNISEANDQVAQYLPAWNDNEQTILSKLDALNERLGAMTDEIYKGRGTNQGQPSPQDGQQPQIYNFNAETGDLE